MTQRKRTVRSNTPPFDSTAAKRAVLKVGEGFGFVIEFVQPSPNTKGLSKLHDLPPFDLPPFFRSRFIITAAHCLPSLPYLPPSRSLLYPHEKTYLNLLGPLDTRSPSIAAECVFVDPVANIAVLGEPDGMGTGPNGEPLAQAARAFLDFTAGAVLLSLSKKNMVKPVTGWLLSVSGQWTPCRLKVSAHTGYGPTLRISEATDGLLGGMSGSPILLDDGLAIGMFVKSSDGGMKRPTEGGPQPLLMQYLPGWLVRQRTAGLVADS